MAQDVASDLFNSVVHKHLYEKLSISLRVKLLLFYILHIKIRQGSIVCAVELHTVEMPACHRASLLSTNY